MNGRKSFPGKRKNRRVKNKKHEELLKGFKKSADSTHHITLVSSTAGTLVGGVRQIFKPIPLLTGEGKGRKGISPMIKSLASQPLNKINGFGYKRPIHSAVEKGLQDIRAVLNRLYLKLYLRWYLNKFKGKE